ncbi:MAG: aminotransferase class I/II-fold pyridoxal phosphate-dependent enzyme [Verrucomicrobiales bacterium]|nr:aminotransferase class I/II-fold pyridoxal phosphate-dependent enzyme [Verrucomicrobiales bacterium]
MHEPPVLQQIDETHVLHQGRSLVYFGGSDYLRLSWHPQVRAAMARGVEALGTNSAASRSTTGNLPVYGELESQLQRFFGTSSATLVSAGYMAPLVAAQALGPEHDAVLLDERVHACLHDAASLTGLPVRTFAHRDPAGLKRELNRANGQGRVLVMTDGLFSSTGDAAPLAEYLPMLARRGTLLVDDAHGVGVLGLRGRGTLEWAGVPYRRVVVTGTLSKAFGCYGGLVLGSRALRSAIFQRSRLFVGNTPPPPPCAAAGLAALEVLRLEGKARRERMQGNMERLRAVLREIDGEHHDEPGPMLAIRTERASTNERIRRLLLESGIYPSLIRYPNGPSPCFFRFAVSSEHTPSQISALAEVLRMGLRRRS